MNFDKIYHEEYPVPNKYLVDVNWDCNLNCKMCVKRGLSTPFGQKPLSTFTEIVEKLPWAREISLGCLGDAFSYKEFGDAMKYLKTKKITAPFTTNATQLDDDNIQYLSQNNAVYVSIDSGDTVKYKEIRGKDCLDIVKQNIKKLKRLNPPISIGINNLVFNDNLQYAEELIKFLSPYRIPITFFYPIHFYKELEKKCNFWNLSDTDRQKQINELLDIIKTYNLPSMVPSAVMKERVCFRAFLQPMIAYDGSVYPCDYIYQDMNNWDKPEWNHWFRGECTKIPQHQYKMGNIFEDNFITMWNSPKWKQLRSQLTDLNNNGVGKPYEDIKKEIDLKKPFDHCKACLVRWSACL